MFANREAIPGLELEVSNRDLTESFTAVAIPNPHALQRHTPFTRLEKEMH
jgi:hypothetical protein